MPKEYEPVFFNVEEVPAPTEEERVLHNDKSELMNQQIRSVPSTGDLS
jgi:hypothetical protein